MAQGAVPKENREIPPLDYDRVYRLKERLGGVFVGINGGIATLDEAAQHLQAVDAVMLGRAAYHNPELLGDVDARLYEDGRPSVAMDAIIDAMSAYIDRHIAAGGRLSHVTRHMVGLFTGQPGARRWRQILSTDATKPGATSEVLRQAYAAVTEARAEAA